MKPFLRPTSRARLAPVGWVSEPAGQWADREVEVVYDPRQHQVVLFRNEPNDQTRAELADAGYRRYAADGRQEMWVRDKASQAAAFLDRAAEPQVQERSAGVEALGL